MPPRVDYLYVEQEVMADETPAVDAVLKADKYGNVEKHNVALISA